jgi:hypothetical protein
MVITRRVYLYGIAFVALGMLVAGLSGLLQVLLEALVEAVAGRPATLGADSLRGRVSFSGALAAIGLVAWLIHWGLADRPVRRGGADGGAERRSAIRKLFLYLALFAGGVILTLAGAALLSNLLLALFGRLTWSSVLTGSVVHPLAVLVVGAAFWGYYARIVRDDRRLQPEAGAGATLRRWCVYALSLFGLLVLMFAAAELLRALWEAATARLGAAAGSNWLAVAAAPSLGRLAAGLALWYLAWTWSVDWLERRADPDPEDRSVLRKVYLYLVLLIAVAWTVWNLGRVLYELLRAALIPERLGISGWGILHELGAPIATALVFGLAWAYHARVVGREAARVGEPRRQAAIRWLYGYLVALVGLVALAVGLGGTLATLLDLAVQPAAVRPTHWWEERISLFATLVAVGLPIWVMYWRRLQREAGDSLARESVVRRIYLYLVFSLAMLTLLSSGAFALFQVIRLVLGDAWSGGETSELATAASAAAVAALFLAYHLRVLGASAGPAPGPARAETAEPVAPVLALALVRTADPALLDQLRRELASHAPVGVEVQLLPVDAATAARLAAQAGAD